MIVLQCQTSAWKLQQKDGYGNRETVTESRCTRSKRAIKRPIRAMKERHKCSRRKKNKLNASIKTWIHRIGDDNGNQNKMLSMNQQEWTCQSCSLQQKRHFTFLSLKILVSEWLHTILICYLASLFFWPPECNVKFSDFLYSITLWCLRGNTAFHTLHWWQKQDFFSLFIFIFSGATTQDTKI